MMKSKKKEKKEKSESNNDRIELERIDSCTNDDKRTLHEHRFWQKFLLGWITVIYYKHDGNNIGRTDRDEVENIRKDEYYCGD